MIYYAIGAFAITLFNSILFAFTYRRRYLTPTTQAYFQWSFCVSAWSLGYGLTLGGFFDYQTTLILNKFCQAMATLIGPFFFKLSCCLSNEFPKKKKTYFAYLFIGIVIALFLFTTNYFVKGLWSFHSFKYQPLGGPLYGLFTGFFLLCNLHGFFIAFQHYRKSVELERKRIAFFLIATGIGYGLSAELFLQGFRLPIDPHGVFFMFVYVVILGYAIFRYRFLDIEVIFKKTVVFSGIVGIAVLIIAIPFALIQAVIGRALGLPHPLLFVMIGAVTSVLISKPVEQVLTNITDKYLFQKKFDYRKILKIASEGLANINSLNHQLRLVVHFLTRRARIKGAAIYMPENGENNFILKASRPEEMTNQIKKLEYDSPILLYLKAEKKKTYLEYQSIEDAATKYAKNAMYSYNLPKLLEDMKRLHAQLIVPSFYQGELQGILVLDGKKSDETYNEEDINLFQTIALESAIAFENARKHDELIEQNIKLEQMNDELKRTQAEVIQAKEEAAVSALSGGINHEIKNSIYGLTNNADQVAAALDHIGKALKLWYRSGDAVPVRQKRELFENLEEALGAIIIVQQASQHIDDVARTLAEISKGKYAQMGRISIRTFLKGIVTIGMLRTYGDRVKTQGFENPPEVDAPRELPSVRGHTELLKAVFINFFKNSIYAMDGIFPKKIEIRAMLDPDDKDMVRVEFSDNGKGIPPDVLPKIFDYGFTTKGSEGEGKGLYNVKTIIEGQHKGKIAVQSEVGKGTTFIIKLPIWKEEEELQ